MMPYSNFIARILFLLVCSLWFAHESRAQTTAITEAEQFYEEAEQLFYAPEPTDSTDRAAIEKYRQAIEKYTQAAAFPLIRAEAYQKIGNILEMTGSLPEALESYRQSVATKRSISGISDSLFFTDYIYTGNTHYLLENFDSAEYYLYQAEAIALRYDHPAETSRLYNLLGLLNFSLGNYVQSVRYFTKTLSLLQENERNYFENTIILNNNLANAQARLGNHREAIRIYRSHLDQGVSAATLLQNLGRAYMDIQQYDSAAFFVRQALYSSHLPTRLAAHNCLGEIYLKQGLQDSALFYFQASAAINRTAIGAKNTSLAEAFLGQAEVSLARSDYAQALTHYQQALIHNVFSFDDTDFYQNPNDFRQAISFLHLFSTLRGKGSTLYRYYQQRQDTSLLTASLHCYQYAIQLAKHIQKTYDTDDAKLFFVEHIYPVFEEALATAYTLYEVSRDDAYILSALKIAEAGKASVLAETLHDLEIKSSGLVNDRLIREEKRLKQKITSLRIRLAQSSDTARNQAYQASLTDLEIALARTIKTLQKDDKYYQLKYQHDSLDLPALQQQVIGPDAALLEYVTGQNVLYAFVITQAKVSFYRIPLPPAFHRATERLQSYLFNYLPGQRYEGMQAAAFLHRFLLQPLMGELHSKERLIIVPDGVLSFIPFDILPAAADAPATYLIQEYTTSYGYSASLLLDAVQHRNVKLANTVLAMAPFAGKDRGNIRSNGFKLLAASREEVEKIGGSIYLEDKATKRLFLEVAGSYGILHLATHASVDSENPLQSYIAFYPDQNNSDAGYRLYTHELYNLQLDNVKLVVLSACEAGGGQLVSGEGIISLARAFAYAGCPNIVTTLWKADDRSAAEITSSMHQYLKSGYSKDEALRLAKIDYLRSDLHPVLKAPYYWANFIFIGDPTPIYTSYTYLWYVAGAVLAFILIFWLLGRRTPPQDA